MPAWVLERLEPYRSPVLPPPAQGPDAAAIVEELVAGGVHTSEVRSREFLDAALATNQVHQLRIDSAERRAATLQGAVAVAFTLVIGAGGLLLNLSDVSWGIRAVLVGSILVVLGLFFAAGHHAVQALTRAATINWITEDGLRRSALDNRDCASLLWRGALVVMFNRNAKATADSKIAHVRVAARWLSVALVALSIAAAGLLGVVASNVTKTEPSECEVQVPEGMTSAKCQIR